jgi:DNA-binding transcriptional MerR regulator
VTTAPAPHSRAHLSIGEVLSLLQDEFPDVTISKIRFLESQGLLDPERTPSGYRKFYDQDIDRLRSILRLQKEHYLPLKVIKDRLDAGVGAAAGAEGAEAEPVNGAGDEPASATGRRVATVPGRAATRPPGPASRPSARAPTPPGRVPATAGPPTRPVADRGGRDQRDDRAPTSRPGTEPRRPRANPARTVPRGPSVASPPGSPSAAEAVSLSVDELAEASGLSVRDIRDLERFGLIEARDSSGGSSYDSDALIVAQTAAGFLQHGIEARHMRSYKVASDREAGLFEQIVSPVLKQRNPEARTRASRTVTELIRLGEVMRGVLLRRELRDHLGGR